MIFSLENKTAVVTGAAGYFGDSFCRALLDFGCKVVLLGRGDKIANKAQEYSLEYGKDAIELHRDAISKGDRVLIVDDLIATGGTARATGDLVKRLGGEIASFAFLIELVDLDGGKLLTNSPVLSIIQC